MEALIFLIVILGAFFLLGVSMKIVWVVLKGLAALGAILILIALLTGP